MLQKQTGGRDGMAFEDVKPSTRSKDVHKSARKAYKNEVMYQSTWYTLYLLLNKHKVGFLIATNAMWLLGWMVPAWPQLVLSLLGK